MKRAPQHNRKKRAPRRNRVLRWLNPFANRRVATPTAGPDRSARWRQRLARGKRALITSLRVLVPLLVLGSMGVLGYFGSQRVLASGYFNVKRLHITGLHHLTPADLTVLSTETGGLIFNVDLDRVERDLTSEPWIDQARIRRMLPDTLLIDITEHRPRAALVMHNLYLVNERGQVFKRADLDEADGLPLITGIDREAFTDAPEQTHERLKKALAALDTYRGKDRPAVGEVNVDSFGNITFFLDHRGVGLYFGNGVTEKRLGQLDHVWAALGPKTDQAHAIFLDNRVRDDRVVVRMQSNAWDE